MTKSFKIEKKLIAQVKYYETLHVIKDERGELIFTGSEEMAKKLLRILKQDAQRKGKRK